MTSNIRNNHENKTFRDNIDPTGVGRALELFPDQIKTAYEQAVSSDLEKLSFSSVVLSGMGGSSNAGKIIASLIELTSTTHFSVYNNYGLPGWVNENTLVVLNSYSGNTEETLSAYDAAKEKGCLVVGVTTGGKIGDLINSGQIKGLVFSAHDTNPPGFPKSGLGLSFGALFGVLTKVGLLNFSQEDLLKALEELSKVRESWKSDKTAQWLNGKMGILLAGKSFIGPLNAGTNAMCEISRNFTQFYDFPEVNHVLIEATLKPNFVKEKVRYLFFESKFDNQRIKTRFKITKKILDEQGLVYSSVMLQCQSFLGQCLELPHFCAWLGYHLSLLQDTDPGPEPWISKLKEMLQQPVH